MGENSEFEGLSNEELLSILQREKDIYAQLGSKLESLASENAQTVSSRYILYRLSQTTPMLTTT